MWHQVTLALLLCRVALANISVEGNAYTGIVVSIRDDIEEEDCDATLDAVKNMITEGSKAVHGASQDLLYFGDVTIVVPSSWMQCSGDVGTSNVPWDEAPLRVGPSHPIFGPNPWTQQLRGCGQPGDFIYLPLDFVTAQSPVSPQGSLLAHEWAKYRWGVFEEYGHRGDEIYPAVVSCEETNYCSNGEVPGNFVCDENPPYFLPNVTLPSDSNSSIMATPFLPSVLSFCDNNNHLKHLPNKHNFICDKASTWEVVMKHDDTSRLPSSLKKTNFHVAKFQSDVKVEKADEKASVTLNKAPVTPEIKLWSTMSFGNLQFTQDSAPILFATVTDGYDNIVQANVIVTVTEHSIKSPVTLLMRDDGIGADMTGNDGIYSCYLLGLSSTGEISIQASATDNGTAHIFRLKERTPPVVQEDMYRSCCGSKLMLPDNLTPAEPFSVELSTPITGTVSGEPTSNLPPGRVSDLRSSVKDNKVILTFTAPGSDFDHGTVEKFSVILKRDGSSDTTVELINNQEAYETVERTVDLPDCEVDFRLTVYGVDSEGRRGKPSNEVTANVVCTGTKPSTVTFPSSTVTPPVSGTTESNCGEPCDCLSPGAIAGLVVGCVLGTAVVIIVVEVIIYMILKKKRKSGAENNFAMR